jgi:multimeric flavodoxin WrbA
MKKVLLLSGSHRKNGNSDLLCDQFMLGAKESGHQAEKIIIRDKKINYCLACDACKRNGGTCVQKDDMNEILDKMMAADVFVLATPVYFYSMSAQMKTMIDRTYAKYTEIRDKEMYFIITAADDREQYVKRAIDGFRGFTSCLDGSKEKGIIYGLGVCNASDIKGSQAMVQAYEMGKNI